MNRLNINLVPIGVIPETIWKLRRYQDISEAIERYLEVDADIPSKWLKELSRLEKELKTQ